MASFSLTPPQLHNNSSSDNQVLEDVAIDFRQLMREEKKRAKEKRQRQQEAKKSNDDGVEQQQHQKTTLTSLIDPSPPSIDNDWPTDWLATDSMSTFTPDYACTLPAPTVLYKQHFLSDETCRQLEAWLQSLPSNKRTSTTSNITTMDSMNGTWNTMKYAKRRVCMFDTTPTTTTPSTSSTQPSLSLPLPLQQLSQALVDMQVFPHSHPPNHVLINEYSNSQGILPHTDGPLYYPKTATLSIGCHVLLYFQKRLATDEIGLVENPVELQVLLEHGSLVVFAETMYAEYCHGIDDVLVEYASHACGNATEGTRVSRGHRISLTFRHKYMAME